MNNFIIESWVQRKLCGDKEKAVKEGKIWLDDEL